MSIVQERREVAGFDEVVLEGSGTITLTQGEQDGLVIETEESFLPRLKSEVVEGRLRLGLKSWLDIFAHFGFPPVHYYVTMREVHGVLISGSGRLQAGRIETDRLRLKTSGAGEMSVEELRAGDLEINFSGSGKAVVGGAVETQTVRISGTGELHADHLDCAEARVHISGSGKVRVRAARRLDVHISGSGDVGYIGQPNISHHISGAGKVREIQPA
jgi:hypothetical protein